MVDSEIRFRDSDVVFGDGTVGLHVDIPSASPVNFHQAITAPADMPRLVIDAKLFVPPCADGRPFGCRWRGYANVQQNGVAVIQAWRPGFGRRDNRLGAEIDGCIGQRQLLAGSRPRHERQGAQQQPERPRKSLIALYAIAYTARQCLTTHAENRRRFHNINTIDSLT